MESIILKPDNVQTIISTAPEAYTQNKVSHDRCLDAGEKLLTAIQQGGMNEELDMHAAEFIRKARATVKVMLERRSPSTKLMDEIRAVFTQLESDIDPANKKSQAYKLQSLRNEYAANKIEQAEAARRAAAEAAAAKMACEKYRAEVQEDYIAQFNDKLESDVNRIIDLATQVNLETYSNVYDTISKWECTLPAHWFLTLGTSIMAPTGIKEADLIAIRGEVVSGIIRRCQDQYQFEVSSTRDKFLEMLPSKKVELEQALMNPANKSEIEAQIKEAEQQRIEAIQAIRTMNQDKVTAQTIMDATNTASDLFAAVQAADTHVNANVKKRVALVNGKGILKIIALWWEYAGKDLSPEELEKMFKKQLTLCEKLANQPNPVLLNDSDIAYHDVVIAK